MVSTCRDAGVRCRIIRGAFWLLFWQAIPVWAQMQECRDELPGYLVRSVQVRAHWFPRAPLPLERGDAFTPDKVSELRLAVLKVINGEKDRHQVEFLRLGRVPLVGLSSVRACGRPAPVEICRAEGLADKCTDVEVQAFTLSVDAVNIGSTLLPLPRTNRFSFLSEAPRPLRIFNPSIGLEQDSALGTTPELKISTDLFALPALTRRAAPSNKASLLLEARGGKSLNNPYYLSRTNLIFQLNQPTQHIESTGLETGFTADQIPRQARRYLMNVFRIGGHLAFNPAAGLVNRVIINAAYRRSTNRLERSGFISSVLTTEDSCEARMLLEGRLWNGFTRFALWYDGGKPKVASKLYRRVAVLTGFDQEIPFGDHTLGVEALLGAGQASDGALEYARFYGGNTLTSFLYDEVNEPNLIAMPGGPLLRSFGRNQAGAMAGNTVQGGADSYQHFNLTLSFPLPRLSAPLIPNEQVTQQKTLRGLIKDFSLDSGQEALSLSFQEEGLGPAEADQKAKKIFDEIRPGVNYLADHAKIYALKPLFMFDVARLTRIGGVGAQSMYAIGGGLQLTIVVAKFEIGYMHTVRGFEGDRHGNLIARLVFQNLF